MPERRFVKDLLFDKDHRNNAHVFVMFLHILSRDVNIFIFPI